MQLVEYDRVIHTGPRRPLWVWVLAAGCGEPQDELLLVGLRDGAYVGGLQVSAIETSTRSDVLRAELFLDGLRIAQGELAPFELVPRHRGFDRLKRG